MIEQILKNLVEEKQRMGLDKAVISNLLKEILQFYLLDFIYNSSYGQNLIFTGGSALRVCFGMNRLSEDLDFDLEWQKEIDKKKLAQEVLVYFREKFGFSKIEAKIAGRQKKIYLKFPILYDLGISQKSASDKLYVKIEIASNISSYYQTEFTPVAKLNLNFIVKNYILETLMASKIITILRRTFEKGKGGKITFKGRDYYDLLWFFQKGIKPDMRRLKDVLGFENKKKIYLELEKKIRKIKLAYLKEDLLPLFEDGRFIENYCRNYKKMIEKYLDIH